MLKSRIFVILLLSLSVFAHKSATSGYEREKFPTDKNLSILIRNYVGECVPFFITLMPNSTPKCSIDEVKSLRRGQRTLGYFDTPIITYSSWGDSLKTIQSIKRPMLRMAPNCIASIFIIYDLTDISIVHLARLMIPSVNPFIFKDQEKVLAFTRKNNLHKFLKSVSFGRKLKHKMGIIWERNQMEFYTSCEFCAQKEIFRLNFAKYQMLFPDYEKNFGRSILRISTPITTRAVLNYKHLGGGKYLPTTGSGAFLLNYFQEKFNFTLELKPASRGGGTGSKLPNGSWTGAISDIVYGDTDIIACVGETFERAKLIAFTSSVNYQILSGYTGPSQKIYVWTAIFWPFTLTTWSCFVASIILSIILIHVAYKVLSIPEQHKWKTSRVIQYMFGSFVGQVNYSKSIRFPNAVKIYLILWGFCMLTLANSYVSKLIGFLTFPVVEEIPKTYEEVVKSGWSLGFTSLGGVAHSMLKASKVPTYRNIVNRVELMNNHYECFLRMMTFSKFFCITYNGLATHYIHNNFTDRYGRTPFVQMPNPLLSIGIAMGTEKRAVFYPNFEETVKITVYTGLVDEWARLDLEYLRKVRIAREKRNPVRNLIMEKWIKSLNVEKLLTIENFHGAFVILGIGITLGLVAFFGEEVKSLL